MEDNECYLFYRPPFVDSCYECFRKAVDRGDRLHLDDDMQAQQSSSSVVLDKQRQRGFLCE